MSHSPLVSIILPVYNADKYLSESIESILSQSFSDFELLILDDGSSDQSYAVASSYRDPRIKLIRSDSNIGIVGQLNKGISIAKGKYIARMDADDISLPERIHNQVTFLESNLNVDACGTWLETFGADSPEIWKSPLNHNEIGARLFFGNCLFHPTMIFRSHTLREGYTDKFLYAEDYELWSRLFFSGFIFANIPKVLLRYRIHHSQSSSVSNSKQTQSALQIAQLHLEKINPSHSERKVYSFLIGNPGNAFDPILINDLFKFRNRVFGIGMYDPIEFDREFRSRVESRMIGYLTSWEKFQIFLNSEIFYFSPARWKVRVFLRFFRRTIIRSLRGNNVI